MKKSHEKHHEHRKVLLEWEAPEFMPTPRGRTWYIVAGLVLLGFIAYAIYTDSLTMAIVFIMLALVFILSDKIVASRLRDCR